MSEPSTSESYEINRSKSNRRFRAPSNPWLPYIGDCKALEKYLNSKNGVAWLIPKYINALLRGISQVILANNPLSGLVILIALFWFNVFVGLAAITSATTAILTALLMRQDPALIAAGLTTYNAVLVGTVTSSLWTPLYGEALGVKMWSFVILGSALTVFVTSAASNILASLKIPLPAITLPFNLVILLLFITLMPAITKTIDRNQDPDGIGQPVALRLSQQLHEQEHLFSGIGKSRYTRDAEDSSNIDPATSPDKENESGERSNQEMLNWGKTLRGVIVSAGQVYGIHNEFCSVLIYIGLLIYSPILFMMSGFGAILGTICGIMFAPAPFDDIYNGLWGYNGLLSAASVGGFFIVLTCHSFWSAMVNVVFTALIQQALIISLGPARLPVFTLPFVLSTLVFLSVTTAGNHMPRVDSITFPEMHRYFYREARRVKRDQKPKKQSSIVADEIAEEKELVLTDVKIIGEDIKEHVQVEVTGDSGDGGDDETKNDDLAKE